MNLYPAMVILREFSESFVYNFSEAKFDANSKLTTIPNSNWSKAKSIYVTVSQESIWKTSKIKKVHVSS